MKYSVTLTLLIAAYWTTAESKKCADPQVIKNIKELIWKDCPPVNILENEVISGRMNVALRTADFETPDTALYSITTSILESHGVPFYIRESQGMSFEKELRPPKLKVVVECEPGILTVPEYNWEIVVAMDEPDVGIRAHYKYDLTDCGDEYSSDGVILIDSNFKSRDALCRAINTFELSGLSLNKTELYVNYISETKQWVSLDFDYSHCIGNEYVKNIEEFFKDVDKKIAPSGHQ